MSHNWHTDNLEGCTTHASNFAHSCLRVLQGEHINSTMQAALADDMRDVVEDLERIKVLIKDLIDDDDTSQLADRSSYIQHLEGVVFIQLHQIQQLRKEVARHAAPA